MGLGGATCVVYHRQIPRVLAVKSDKRLGEGGTQTFINRKYIPEQSKVKGFDYQS
jgi:hypothetical protein